MCGPIVSNVAQTECRVSKYVLYSWIVSGDLIFFCEPMVHMEHTNDEPLSMLMKLQQLETNWKNLYIQMHLEGPHFYFY